ncbi:IS21 family transposase [Brevibacillus massiliensis]|uniref:IS21 family transposase n=1 Tax=Brevibacillus massiliensis TaxID=1118054 RepID=UPI0002F75E33|nr:IS21 family transposase [Brevibacillus massiliensis]
MIKDLYQNGMSISAIARKLDLDRKTVRKYIEMASYPVSSPKRKQRPSKLDPFKQYLEKRMLEDGVFNAEKLLLEIKRQGYLGGKTILKDFIKPFRQRENKKYTLRYETKPGEQMQVDWKELGEVDLQGVRTKLYMFVAILGYSRMKYMEFTRSQDQEHLLRCLINSFQYFGGVPQKVLFDNMKTVTDGREAGLVKWNKRFAEFASYYGFIPKVCRPYRAQTKGKVERAIQYITNHFYQGTSFETLDELNSKGLRWLDAVGNRKPNQTTGVSPQERWPEEKLSSLSGICDFDTSYRTYRRVYYDGMYSYKGEHRMVRHDLAGEQILIKESLDGLIKVYFKDELIESYRPSPKLVSLAQQIKKKQQNMDPNRAVSQIKVATRPLTEYDRLLRGDQ